MPAYLSDVFGVKALSAIHGHILTAWGMAGLLAPLFTAWLKEMTSSYGDVLNVFIIFYCVALVIAVGLFKVRHVPLKTYKKETKAA